MKRAFSLLLAFSLILSLFACGKEPITENISETVSSTQKEVVESIAEILTTLVAPSTVPETKTEPEPTTKLRCLEAKEFAPPLAYCTADFGLRLFNEIQSEQKNPLISPLSVISALTMAGLGAESRTLEQITNALKQNPEELALYLQSYMNSTEMTEGISLANSIWLNGTRFYPKSTFISDCTQYLDAEVFSDPFNKSTVSKINSWITKKTDGEIKNVLDEVPANAMAYLINTVLFEAEWLNPYTSYTSVQNQTFTTEDGRKQNVSMLCSSHSSDAVFTLGKTTGIFNSYTNGYSFVALLPDEGVSIKEAAESFTAKEFISTVADKTSRSHFKSTGTLYSVRLPKFEAECSYELRDALSKMGITDAFCDKADFSKMGTSPEGYIYFSRALHKTHIALTEKGTKAGAATVMEFKAGSVMIDKIIQLYFDRPFLYAIVENETGMPVFFGAVTDFE